MKTRAKITIPKEQISAFCHRNHIKKLALYCSVLCDDFRSDSDVDIVVEFEHGKTPELAFFTMQDELSELFGRQVSLNTPGFLSPHVRDHVLTESESVYAEI